MGTTRSGLAGVGSGLAVCDVVAASASSGGDGGMGTPGCCMGTPGCGMGTADGMGAPVHLSRCFLSPLDPLTILPHWHLPISIRVRAEPETERPHLERRRWEARSVFCWPHSGQEPFRVLEEKSGSMGWVFDRSGRVESSECSEGRVEEFRVERSEPALEFEYSELSLEVGVECSLGWGVECASELGLECSLELGGMFSLLLKDRVWMRVAASAAMAILPAVEASSGLGAGPVCMAARAGGRRPPREKG